MHIYSCVKIIFGIILIETFHEAIRLTMHFLFQNQLPKFFPDYESICSNLQVIKLACGLTVESQIVLEHVYDVMVHKILLGDFDEYFDEEFRSIFESLWQETSPEELENPLRNLHANVCFGENKDDAVWIPSKYYVFQSFNTVPKCVRPLVDMSTLKQIPEAGYVIRGVGNCQLNNSLEVLQMISKHQKVFVNRLDIEDVNLANAYRRTIRQLLELLETDGTSHNFPQCFLFAIGRGITEGDIKTLLQGMLQKGGETVTRNDIVSVLLELIHKNCEGFSENDRLAKFFEATVHISKDIVAVKAVHCDFAPSFFNYFVRQLHGCQKLVELDLSKTLLVPAELGKALPTMKALQKVKINYVKGQVMVSIMIGLSSCYHLRHLDLGRCILTDCLTYLFDSANNDRFADLSDLHLPETMLSAGDLKSISVAVRSNIIPSLCSLVMSGNILTNSLHELLGGNEHRGFPSLQVLDLTNTALLERDLSCLFGAIRHGKCSVLKKLKFQPTTLIGCLDDFVNSGIERKKLSLKNAGLSETDVRILRTAVQNDRFHLLRQLDLSENILTGYVENAI